MLGHAESVVNRGIAATRIQSRHGTHFGSRHAGDRFSVFRSLRGRADKVFPFLEGHRFAARGNKIMIDQILINDHMGNGIDQRDIGAGLELQMMSSLDMRHTH